jgi:hypothetical protein
MWPRLRKIVLAFRSSSVPLPTREDYRGLYTDPPKDYSGRFPDLPRPGSRLSLELLAARWTCHDLYGEDMPRVAADLLEAEFDSPALRRLAGEILVERSADVEELVGRVFRELGISLPLSEYQAKMIFTRQIAREVIWGERNAWVAANYLEIAIWGWQSGNIDLNTLFELNDAIDLDPLYRPPFESIESDLVETFARLAAEI